AAAVQVHRERGRFPVPAHRRGSRDGQQFVDGAQSRVDAAIVYERDRSGPSAATAKSCAESPVQ
ncbi:hypothetical protein ABZ319_32065, partial [Nocardia sp. NPDC005978]|uniref:hypothetical protein n=1 Tax=Nocardia sp. NPDC005978 TaxID=3156725 RepID=UPI0033A51BEE